VGPLSPKSASSTPVLPPSGISMGAASVRRKLRAQFPPVEALVHLVGVTHPSPAKAREFGTVDLVSVRAAVFAARSAGVSHFIYVSVAHRAR
jgi:nucleoside-diphosphate-sugar epimerase